MRSDWQLPRGVPRGVWDYTQSKSIASDYDDYFREHGLMAFDESLLGQWCQGTGCVVDFGCGTGRVLQTLLARGMSGIGIDLSLPMLQQARERLAEFGDRFFAVRGNLVELDFIASEIADYGLCLFSTLGMIAGSDNRQLALGHMSRILKPNGELILHVHNFWFNLYDPGGPWWLLKSLLLRRKGEQRGDKRYNYRGIREFYLHVFSRREILQLLAETGLTPVDIVPLRRNCDGALPAASFFQNLRASGWIIRCRKLPSTT